MDLETSITELPLVGDMLASKLERLRIKTIKDLLYHIPTRYLDFRNTSEIARVQPEEIVTIKGKVISIKNIYTRSSRKIQIARIKDTTGEIDAVWFNQPFLIKNLPEGTMVSLAGKVNWFGRKKSLIMPEYEKVWKGKRKTVHTGRLIPVYHETSGISSKWIRGRISFVFPLVKVKIKDPLPKIVKEKNSLLNLQTALKKVHFPRNLKEVELGRKRLAFDELLSVQLKSLRRRNKWKENHASFKIDFDQKEISKFLKSLPFELTSSQKKSIDQILKDLRQNTPMNRLLEGDVGSGKTIVAATAAFACFLRGHQSVFMAPTQILAEQHYNTLKKILSPFKVRVSLVTSAGIKKDMGSTDIFIGTHALIHRELDFRNIALVVIDEQQKFGVKQRNRLIKKSGSKSLAPHILTMTATPIPRTIALALYGDLDLSTLDELPKGRKTIKTKTVSPKKREAAYQWVEEKIKKDKVQAFVICPLIEASEKETMKQVKAATVEFKNVSKIFPDFSIGLLHGRLKAEEKNKVLNNFKKKKIDILVSTPVVEVGIDVPNATIMLIEAAERFGLAQLHQLRGRIGRGKKKSYCLLFAENYSEKAKLRLSALEKTNSGFELAELDLKLRGPGEVLGTRQHGFPELKVASWQDRKMISLTKKVAKEAFKKPEIYKETLDNIFNE
ncbi:MAG: ATP-dependent DNA helicase RecG [Patescibacteria group bacterium]